MKTQLSLLALLCLTSSAHAGWTVKVLHPTGATSSQAYCTDGVTVGGQVDGRAAIWNINSGAVTYLSAPGSDGAVTALSGGRQGGSVTVASNRYAAEWNGSAASEVKLTPPAFGGSELFAGFGGRWGGRVGSQGEYNGIPRNVGAVWSVGGGGASGFVVDPGRVGEGSQINGMSANSEVGHVYNFAQRRASVFTGGTHSYTDLHPDGFDESDALACADGVQVGWANKIGGPARAALWRGTKESYVDLTPFGSTGALLNGTDGMRHVGYNGDGVSTEAMLWDTGSKLLNFSKFLPNRTGRGSVATGISTAATGTSRVCGWFNQETFPASERAVVWVEVVPEPTGMTIIFSALLVCAVRKFWS